MPLTGSERTRLLTFASSVKAKIADAEALRQSIVADCALLLENGFDMEAASGALKANTDNDIVAEYERRTERVRVR